MGRLPLPGADFNVALFFPCVCFQASGFTLPPNSSVRVSETLWADGLRVLGASGCMSRSYKAICILFFLLSTSLATCTFVLVLARRTLVCVGSVLFNVSCYLHSGVPVIGVIRLSSSVLFFDLLFPCSNSFACMVSSDILSYVASVLCSL